MRTSCSTSGAGNGLTGGRSAVIHTRWLSVVAFTLGWAACTAQAAVTEYVRDYTYQGARYDSESTCRVNAVEGVKRELLEELGTYIGSVVKLHQDSLGNSYMSQDVVNITAGIVSMKVLEERWKQPDYFIRAGMKADPDDVLVKLKALRADLELEKALRDSYEALEQARRELASLRAQLARKQTPNTAALPSTTEESPAEIATQASERTPPEPVIALAEPTPQVPPEPTRVTPTAMGLVARYEQAAQDVEVAAAFQRALAARLSGDFGSVYREMRTLADRGVSQAQFRLGWLYERGVGVAQDYAEARAWYERAMQNGSAAAVARMGMLYEHGMGVEKDYAKAVAYNQRAIEAGEGLGYAQMGYLYQTGKGVKLDLRKAAALYQTGMEKGNYLAMVRLGFLYQKGRGVEQNEFKAAALYRSGVDHGQPLAMARLGQMYNFGMGGLPKDHARAMALIKESMRYKLPASFAFMGFMYENGWEVPRDYGRARELYEQAAALDVPFAEMRLGIMYLKGIGVARDRDRARYWLERAADLGEDNARAILSRMR